MYNINKRGNETITKSPSSRAVVRLTVLSDKSEAEMGINIGSISGLSLRARLRKFEKFVLAPVVT